MAEAKKQHLEDGVYSFNFATREWEGPIEAPDYEPGEDDGEYGQNLPFGIYEDGTPINPPDEEEELLPDSPPTRQLSEVKTERVEWLVPGLVPYGMLTMLYGEEKVGKGLWTASVAAQLSRGEFGPDLNPEVGVPEIEERIERGDFSRRDLLATTLFVASEDAAASIIRPRLQAAEAKLDLVRVWDFEREGFSLPSGIEKLDRELTFRPAALVVLDPITAMMDSGTDAARQTDARAVTTPLDLLARKHGCAFVLVLHTNRAASTDSRQRAGQSLAWRQAARNGLLMGRHPEDERQRVIVHDFCNVTEPSSSRQVEIRSVTISAQDGGPQIETAKIIDLGECDLTAQDLFATSSNGNGQTRLEEAKELIASQLADGPRRAADVQAAAAAFGVSESTLKRAKKDLDVRSFKQKDGWYWTLPDQDEFAL